MLPPYLVTYFFKTQPTKISTLNLCLGLKSKKDEIRQLIQKNNIDILCLQEVELEHDYESTLLDFMGYNLETVMVVRSCDSNEEKINWLVR